MNTAEGHVVLPRAESLSILREYAVDVVALATSPGHSYWFHSRDPSVGVGPHPTIRRPAVDVVAGQGIVGDRFFGKVSKLSSESSMVSSLPAGAKTTSEPTPPARLRRGPGPVQTPPRRPASSAVSFVAAEAVEAVARELGLAPDALDPVVMRRNVVLRGVDLNALRRRTFAFVQGDAAPLWFEAAGETSPCAWMDAVLAPGARDLLRGRGGLRAGPTTSGRLAVGPATLLTDVEFDPARAGHRVRRGRLP